MVELQHLPNIDVTDLRILHSLECCGSIAGVGEQLGISQPAISQRIKRLEERLEMPLSERAGRTVRLTPAGKILAASGERVVAEFASAFEKIAALRDDKGGFLRLVGFPSASATVVPEMMRAMRQLAPGVTLQYREAEPPGALDLLRAGEVDCALIFDYQNTVPLPAGAEFLPLWQEELRLVAAADDPRIGAKQTAQLRRFRQDHWIAGCEKCRGNLMTAAAEENFVPDVVQETDNIPAMVAMVAAGGAVALVPQLALAGMRLLPPEAQAVPLDPPRRRTIGLAFMHTTHQNPAVRLARALAAQVDPAPWQLRAV